MPRPRASGSRPAVGSGRSPPLPVHVGPGVAKVFLSQLRVGGVGENLIDAPAEHHVPAEEQRDHALVHPPKVDALVHPPESEPEAVRPAERLRGAARGGGRPWFRHEDRTTSPLSGPWRSAHLPPSSSERPAAASAGLPGSRGRRHGRALAPRSGCDAKAPRAEQSPVVLHVSWGFSRHCRPGIAPACRGPEPHPVRVRSAGWTSWPVLRLFRFVGC